MAPIAKHASGWSLRVIGSLLMLCFVMSCHDNKPTENRSGQDDVLKEKINSLQYEPLGTINLGNACAVRTENTEYIIEQKDRAVPLLIEALKNNEKPVQVAYAAYCLRRIGSDKGKEVAAVAYERLAKRGEELRIEERFARSELKDYLDSLNENR